MKLKSINKRTFIFLTFIVISLFLPLNLYSKGPSNKNKTLIAAQMAQENVSYSDLKSYISHHPLPHHSLITKDTIQKRLDEMVTGEVLYQEAIKQNIHEDPEIKRRIQQILSQKLIEEKIDKQISAKPIEEKEIKDYYNEHKYEFDHPEQVRLADIFISLPPKSSHKHQTELKRKAESVLREALNLREKKFGFGKLMKKYSDEHEGYPYLGDTGYFDIEGKPIGLHKNLTEAAFNLKRTHHIHDQVIETPEGYHVVMLIGKRPASHIKLEFVKNEIKQRLSRERITKARADYIENLKREADITINEKVINEIQKELMAAREKQSQSMKQTTTNKPKQIKTPPPFPGRTN